MSVELAFWFVLSQDQPGIRLGTAPPSLKVVMNERISLFIARTCMPGRSCWCTVCPSASSITMLQRVNGVHSSDSFSCSQNVSEAMEANKNRDDGPALHESASDTDRQTQLCLFVQPAQRSPLHPKARLARARGSRDTCGEGVSSRQLQRFDCTTKAHVATTQFTEKSAYATT